MLQHIELRTGSFTRAKEYTSYDVQEIGIGSESCFYKIPTLAQMKELTEMTDKRIKIIFPFIPQAYLQDAKDILDEIIKQELRLSVVLNDLGLIAYLKDREAPDIEVIAGRFFDWSYEMVPWNDNVLREESAVCAEFLKRSRLHNDRKLELFKSLHIGGIELNATRSNLASQEYFAQQGMKTYGHCYFGSLAFSRACPYKRMDESNRCVEQCGQYQRLVFKNKWVASASFDSGKTNFRDADEIKELFPEIYIKGNLLLQKNNIPMEEMAAFDGVILDEALVAQETGAGRILREGV